MLIKSEFNLQFHLAAPTPMVAMLHLRPELESRVRDGNELAIKQIVGGTATSIAASEYEDLFGNRCSRFVAPAGTVMLSGMNVLEIEGLADSIFADALQTSVQELPSEVLQFLLPSRYCEVDQFGTIAQDLFGGMTPGWSRAAAIRDWVHETLEFDYSAARPTKTAMDAYKEGRGVCRDFQHLAITLSRCMNIPARYVTGYLGDIRVPYGGAGDFSAWYEVFLDGQWMTMDARYSEPRIGRILMNIGRDATDVAMTTAFGNAVLTNFFVDSYEILKDGTRVSPLPIMQAEEV